MRHSRLALFAFLSTVALIVSVNACSDLEGPRQPGRPLHGGPPRFDYETCPPTQQMPGGWCIDEFNNLEDAIYTIQGDASCDTMRTYLLDWLYNGGIIKYTDFDQSVGAVTHSYPEREFNSRFNYMDMNASVPDGTYSQQPSALTPAQMVRHEYGHVFYNSSNEEFIDQNITYSCGLGGAHNGGSLGDPAPPI